MSTAKVRNAANDGWVTLTTSNTKVRNASNTGWITPSDTTFKVRNSTNTGWISPLAAGGSTITYMAAGTLSTVMDVSPNVNHQMLSDGTAYGLWIDGPPHPYRDAAGDTYILIPHSENYRFKVNSWDNGAGWVLSGPTLLSARNTLESVYNNRNWVFSVWAAGNELRGLMHHEWYYGTKTVDGIGGFNSGVYGANKRWVNALGWCASSNGGVSYDLYGEQNSSRLVLIPEPWNVQQKDHMYGFFHPSNLVQEGGYFYAAVEQRSLAPDGVSAVCGVSLVRTTDRGRPDGWQFWTGSGWSTVDHNSYQGNNSYQVPHRFFEVTDDFYSLPNIYNSHMGQSLRRHTPSGQWVMFGFAGGLSSRFAYSTSATLANPQFTTLNPITTPNPSDYESPGGIYMSVFDPAATDQNFMNIGNNCVVLVTNGFTQIRKTTLTIS